MRFADRTRHQIFIEPEGLSTFEIYPNGISTSLPFDVQLDLVHSIPGFENAHVTRPGYAIEYDFFDPRDLKSSLETKAIENLFFAGQINGTTGYEEAAAQGIVAGINAGLRVRGREPWYAAARGGLHRRAHRRPDHARHDRALSHVHEPRGVSVELREDNADLRLTPIGRELGLVPDERWRQFEARREWLAKEAARLRRRRREARRRARRRRVRGAARRARPRPTRCCADPASATTTLRALRARRPSRRASSELDARARRAVDGQPRDRGALRGLCRAAGRRDRAPEA